MTIRLNKVTRDLNVGLTTVVEFLQKKGFEITANPNTQITEEQYDLLVKEFRKDKNLRIESEKFSQERQNKERNRTSISINDFDETKKESKAKDDVIKTVIPERRTPEIQARRENRFGRTEPTQETGTRAHRRNTQRREKHTPPKRGTTTCPSTNKTRREDPGRRTEKRNDRHRTATDSDSSKGRSSCPRNNNRGD